VDETGSGLCAVMGFGISGVEPLCSAARSTNLPTCLPTYLPTYRTAVCKIKI